MIPRKNQDVRDCMKEKGVRQCDLAEHLNISTNIVSNRFCRRTFTAAQKEEWMKHIDACASKPKQTSPKNPSALEHKFQIGDKVKIAGKTEIGTIKDIWSSTATASTMYAVSLNDGRLALYSENQLDNAPIPIVYSFEVRIDGNVAVATMLATQGDKTSVYARGHAHILHDGAVGMAQAVSYASKRMFEFLDEKQKDRIYVKN
jgi:hypothetical protein